MHLGSRYGRARSRGGAAVFLVADYALWQRRGQPWHDWAVILPLLVPIGCGIWMTWVERAPGIGLFGTACVLISYHGRHHPLEERR